MAFRDRRPVAARLLLTRARLVARPWLRIPASILMPSSVFPCASERKLVGIFFRAMVCGVGLPPLVGGNIAQAVRDVAHVERRGRDLHRCGSARAAPGM